MDNQRFDAAHAVTFDLGNGVVEVEARPRALVPTGALEALCTSAGPDAARDFGRLVGTEVGIRVASRIDKERSSAEHLVEHLGGELALLGLGSLALERWGKALVFTVSTSPFSPTADGWIAGIFEGAMQRALGRMVVGVELPRTAGTLRVLLTGERGAAFARAALARGEAWGDVLSELNQAGGEA